MLPGSIDDLWLDTANAADLEALARALDDGRVTPPFSATQVQQAGLRPEAALLLHGLAQLGDGTPPTAMAWMLRRLAKDRRTSDLRWSEVAKLVWSGPTEGREPTRDTRLVLAELFGRARHHVLVATYVVYGGRKVFEPLAARMASHPDLEVDFYVHIPPDKADSDDDRVVSEFVRAFQADQWPTGTRMPNLLYDPETLKWGAGQKQTSLHAKCVVVDHRWAFVTSANFTEAAQARNIEAGVLLDHPGLAGALAGRFRALREAGRVRRTGSAGGG